MVKTVLTAAGFVEGETFEDTQFIKPPHGTYAIFLDSFTRRGADGFNLIKEHNYTIELYSDWIDPEAESRIEAALDARGIEYEKSDRTWIQSEQYFTVVYTFTYIEKLGG